MSEIELDAFVLGWVLGAIIIGGIMVAVLILSHRERDEEES